MTLLPIQIAFVLVIFSIVSFYLSSWAFGRRKYVGGAVELAFYLLTAGIYTIGYSLEITSSTPGDILWALRIQFLGIPFITVAFFLFAQRYINGNPLSFPAVVSLMIIPLITFFLVIFIERHSFFYSSTRMITKGAFTVLSYSAGPWYHVHFVYLIAMSLAGEAIMLYGAIRSSGRKRVQAVLVIIAGLFPIVSAVLTPERDWGIDLLPFVLVLTGLFLCIALFRFKMLELVPHARDLAVDSIEEVLIVLDERLCIQDLNESGRTAGFLGNLKPGDYLTGKNVLGKFIFDNRQSINSGKTSGYRLEYDSRTYDLKVYTILGQPGEVSGYVVIVRDITPSVSLLRELERQAIYDDLTGLFNRRHILELAAREVELAGRNGLNIGIILMDVDHFKNINDSYGHLAGDMALRKVADALAREIRAVDLCGRYGGEEFVIICPHSDGDDTMLIAERLRSAVEGVPIMFEDQEIKVTASFGLNAGKLPCGADLNMLLKKTDDALYEAKRNGRNRVAAAVSEYKQDLSV